MMTTAVAKNQIPSSAIKIMTSRTKRFAKVRLRVGAPRACSVSRSAGDGLRRAQAVGESTDAQIDGGGYDIDCGPKMAMTTALKTTPIRVRRLALRSREASAHLCSAQYSNVRSKTSRFGKDHRDKLLDVVYDTDKGHKMCLTTACANTPNIFTAMNSCVRGCCAGLASVAHTVRWRWLSQHCPALETTETR